MKKAYNVRLKVVESGHEEVVVDSGKGCKNSIPSNISKLSQKYIYNH